MKQNLENRQTFTGDATYTSYDAPPKYAYNGSWSVIFSGKEPGSEDAYPDAASGTFGVTDGGDPKDPTVIPTSFIGAFGAKLVQ